MCGQDAIKRLSRRPVHGYDDEEEDLRKLRRFSGESAAIARLHDEGQASLAPRQLDDYELERAMVSAASYCEVGKMPCFFGHKALHCRHARDTALPSRLSVRSVSTEARIRLVASQNESTADYQTYLSEGEGTASEEWRQDRSLNTESPRLHAAMSGSLDSLRSSSGGADVRASRSRANDLHR